MTPHSRVWPVVLLLSIISAPLLLMYIYLFVDTLTITRPGSLIPHAYTLKNWQFLWVTLPGRPNIWRVALNTLIFASASSAIVLSVSSTARYVLSRPNVPCRAFFLAAAIV